MNERRLHGGNDDDEFERRGRLAGAELRRPAPTQGPTEARHVAGRRRAATLAAGAGATVVLAVSLFMLVGRDPNNSPASNTSAVRQQVKPTIPEHVELLGHADLVSALDASAAGPEVATASFDGTIRVWNAFTGEQLIVIYAGTGSLIQDVALSPDTRKVAARFADGSSKYWNNDGGTTAVAFSVPWDDPGYIPSTRMLTSPDGSKRIDLVRFGSAKLVDTSTGHVLALLGAGGPYNAAWSSDGSLVAVKFGVRVTIWRTSTLEKVQTIVFPSMTTGDSMEFTDGDRRIAFTVGDTVIIEAVR